MRSSLLIPLLLLGQFACSQVGRYARKRAGSGEGVYIAANFFSMVEPQFAFGPAVGYRFTERSEFFLEAAYTARSPFYDWQDIESLQGLRTLLQYRYHFLQQGRPLLGFGLFRQRLQKRTDPFMGIEFRYKPFSFASTGTFINHSIHDTLSGVKYRAGATVIGGALIFGNSFTISQDGQWQLEISAGIGGKYRYVNIHDKPVGYEAYTSRHRHQFYPSLPEQGGTAYVPFAIRLRYLIE